VLYTGIYRLRKNHATLLRAFRVFLDSGGRGQLVLAGPLAEGELVLRRIAAEVGIEESVVFPGFVLDEDLAALYSAARVYACPSLYEGFGFTVLEAMACGTPVVCSRMTSLLEAAGSAALYTDVQDPRRFAEALLLAFNNEDERHGLIDEGKEHAKSFSWEHTAALTLEVYEDAVERSAGRAASV
jgi:glycosyltransferase involved in cell wall biosynthesis